VRPPRLLVLGVAAALVLGGASVAAATFTNSATSGTMSVSSTTLAAPTAPHAAQTNCKANKPVTITVGWTATTSAFATGYTVERATTSGGPYTPIAMVAIGTTSYLDADPTLAYSTTYHYVVQATYHSWTATSTQTAVTTLSSRCA